MGCNMVSIIKTTSLLSIGLVWIPLVYFIDSQNHTIDKLQIENKQINSTCIEYKTKWTLYFEPRMDDEDKKKIRCN